MSDNRRQDEKDSGCVSKVLLHFPQYKETCIINCRKSRIFTSRYESLHPLLPDSAFIYQYPGFCVKGLIQKNGHFHVHFQSSGKFPVRIQSPALHPSVCVRRPPAGLSDSSSGCSQQPPAGRPRISRNPLCKGKSCVCRM